MSKIKLIASSDSKEELTKLINEFYSSENCVITEENQIFNSKLNRILSRVKVVYLRKRWRFEMEI